MRRSGDGERVGGDLFRGSVEIVGYASGGGGVGKRTAESMMGEWKGVSQVLEDECLYNIERLEREMGNVQGKEGKGCRRNASARCAFREINKLPDNFLPFKSQCRKQHDWCFRLPKRPPSFSSYQTIHTPLLEIWYVSPNPQSCPH